MDSSTDRISICPGCGAEIIRQRHTMVNISATSTPIWTAGVLSEFVGEGGLCWRCDEARRKGARSRKDGLEGG